MYPQRLLIQIFATDHYTLPLPTGHRFPVGKYALLRQRVAAAGLGGLQVAEAATVEQLRSAHTEDYIERMRSGTMSEREMRRIGFPWSPQVVERSLRSVGATIAACRAALHAGPHGVSVNLAGGTHHAYADHGEGYCIFNDSVVAARTIQAEGRASRIVVIDLDVHQGNGTAALTADDASIFSFSVHGEKNYPFHKEVSDLDIALPDGTGDAGYLAALEEGLAEAIERSHADCAIYLAGADPFEDDRLGRLKLTKAGLLARDQMVLEMCHTAGLPIAITMAGGYARTIEDTADIHFRTIELASRFAEQ
jgi:acetoin utilization deacetylase AcuC-like enzyme